MEVFTSIGDLKNYLADQRSQNKTTGLVPTMGALHQGHISLLELSKQKNDLTICSIFVNPVQFNNQQDLEKYPRTLENDYALLEHAGCSAVFAPSVAEMYPETPLLKLSFGSLETVMEGASRPGHFNGVGIVVSRLFNITQPDMAYFGQKDMQQVAVVKRLVKDLAFPLEIVVAPTVRESDGLAMSSRNSRLSPEKREMAPYIYHVLSEAKNDIEVGISITNALDAALKKFSLRPEFKLDYITAVNAETLAALVEIGAPGSNALCVAAFLGPVRLIDNLIF